MLVTASSVHADVPDLAPQHPFDSHADVLELAEKIDGRAYSTSSFEEATQQYVSYSICSYLKAPLCVTGQCETYLATCFEFTSAVNSVCLRYLHYKTHLPHSN